MLTNYNINNTKITRIPCINAKLEDRENSEKINKTDYKRLIGSLLYVSTKTRPDIAFAVNQAARFSENPTRADLNAGIQILKYLKSTKDYSIHYNGKKILRAYCDADFAGDEVKRRSTSGYIFVLRKQPNIIEINYTEKYSLINHRSRILKLNRMYQTSYMDKKIS